MTAIATWDNCVLLPQGRLDGVVHVGIGHYADRHHHLCRHGPGWLSVRRRQVRHGLGGVRAGQSREKESDASSCIARQRGFEGCPSYRYFDIVQPADLDTVNANIQLNQGAVRVLACGWLGTDHRPNSHVVLCVAGIVGEDPSPHQFSFRLKRYCSVGNVAYTSSFNGISFPGTVVGNTTYFSLSPSYVV